MIFFFLWLVLSLFLFRNKNNFLFICLTIIFAVNCFVLVISFRRLKSNNSRYSRLSGSITEFWKYFGSVRHWVYKDFFFFLVYKDSFQQRYAHARELFIRYEKKYKHVTKQQQQSAMYLQHVVAVKAKLKSIRVNSYDIHYM